MIASLVIDLDSDSSVLSGTHRLNSLEFYWMLLNTKIMIILLLVIRSVVSMDPQILDLLTPLKQYGENCGYESCQSALEGKVNVHIVPHSHGELGSTNTFYGHYTGYDDIYIQSSINMKKILDSTISELWANDKRRFTFSDIPYLFHWWKNRDGTVRRMVYQLLRQGRLHLVGGGWGMSDEGTTSYHAIIDHFTYSLRKLNSTFLECGRPLVAWQADVLGHSKEFASLMAQMGFDALFINPISFDDELFRMRNKSLEFIWRGSDDLGMDSDIFTHKLFDGYWSPPGFCFDGLCNDPLIVSSDSIFSNVKERVEEFIEAIRTRQAPHYTTQNVLVMMGKRFGYYDAPMWFENIDKLINNVNVRSYQEGLKLHVFYSSPICYLKAVHNANPLLPTKQDDFYPYAYDKTSYTTGMFTSRPTLKYLAREGHVYLQISKQLQVQAALGDNNKFFENFMWINGVFQDHNIITGASRPFVNSYYVQKMYAAVQQSTLLIKQAFNKLSFRPKGSMYYRCNFNISRCANIQGKNSFIVVYNPLSWQVTVPVRLPIADYIYSVFDPQGEIVKTAIMKIPESIIHLPGRNSKIDKELVFLAKDLPPMGFRSYYIERNQRLRVRRKKSIIKNINKPPNKKYFIRQTNSFKNEDDTQLNDNEDYELNEELTTLYPNTFSEVGKNNIGNETGYLLTPEYTFVTTTEYYNTVHFENNTEFNEESNQTTIDKSNKKLIELNITTEKTVLSDGNEELNNKEFTSQSCNQSKDLHIKNKYIQINLDEHTRKVSSVNMSNGVNITLDIQFYYYESDEPLKLGRPLEREPGAYIFRALDKKPIPIIDYIETIVYKSNVVEEIHIEYSNYASLILKLYEESPVIEIDWVIGPIPVEDQLGKNVFIRYMTNLVNNATFYTDANGRQTVKRIRDKRASFEPANQDAVAGNYYPVTSKIYIEDLQKNLRLSIFTDRAQGGTCLYDGELDLMIHRRILTDDNNIQAILNETEFNNGLVVRGKHFLYVPKSIYKRHKIFEKKFAKEIELYPQILVSRPEPYGNDSENIWLSHRNEFSGLNSSVPVGVHILTLEKWNDDTILIRLENYLEKSDVIKTGIKIVYLRNLFVNITILEVIETTLGANMWLKDWVPLQWKKEKFVKNFNDFYGNSSEYCPEEELKALEEVDLELGITLRPQQIRTFVARIR